MIYAFDTYYFETEAKTVCIGFERWQSTEYIFCKHEFRPIDNEYISGEFYKRELPCVLSLLAQIDLKTDDIIVIDGFVVLDDAGKLGLGGHLFHHLEGKNTIIGVAKNNFATLNASKREVIRGESLKPTFITAFGIDLDAAAENVKSMAGMYRIPDLLKQLDGLTKIIDIK
jgi:deoxyribonuclease V